MFLIVSGGDAPEPAFLRERAGKAEKVIAADKGAQYCLDAGVTPDLVVGDLDSLPVAACEEIRKRGVMLKAFDPAKDKTDTQIAFEEAFGMGAKSIELVGAIGGRIDHSLANIHLLHAALVRKVDAAIVSGAFRIFLAESKTRLAGMRGATLSLLPLTITARGITLNGFRWPLTDAAVTIGDTLGISNVIISDEASLDVREGVLIVVISVIGEGRLS